MKTLSKDFVKRTYTQIKSIMQPESIAIIGASSKINTINGIITGNALTGGYLGRIYLVNPNTNSIFGRRVYPTIKEIPDKVDVAEIVVPARIVPKVMKEAAEKGVKGVVIVSSGFSEVGNNRLQDEILRIARESNMRIIGPNCFGLINTESELDITFTFSKAIKGSIAFISQSGAICSGTLDWASREELGFSKFVNLGNKCDVDEADLMLYLAKDKQTKVVTLYIEGIKEGRKLFNVAKEVTKDKPVVAIKSGVSDVGARAALSHTASIASSDEIVEAAFNQAGIIRVHDLEELFDLAIAFAYQNPAKGKNVALVSNTGGLAVITADWCRKTGLEIPVFAKETIEKLKEVLLPIASPFNPVDMTGTADYDVYRHVLEYAFREENIDCVIAIFASQGVVTADEPAKALVDVAKQHSKPALAFWMGGSSIVEALEIFKANQIPVYPSPKRVAKAAYYLSKYGIYKKDSA